VYRAFKTSQDVTLQRLYLETMEEVLKNSHKVIIDKSAEGGSGVLPYLPLPALSGGNPSAGAVVSGPAGGSGTQPPSSDAASPPQPSNSGQQ
jgi:hypothetical protein